MTSFWAAFSSRRRSDVAEGPVRVLQSVRLGGVHATYVDHLAGQLDPQRVVVTSFSYREALLGSWDVLHVHWPESLVRHRRRSRALLRTVLLLTLVLRIRLRGLSVVRTIHNVEPHERGSYLERLALHVLDRSVSCHVRLNDATRGRAGTPLVTIPHGHYRAEMLEGSPKGDPDGRGLLFFGFLRPYKGVDALIRAFAEVADPSLRLVIAGEPATDAMRDLVLEAARVDARVRVELSFLPDAELAHLISSASLIVLPYEKLHNSGVVFAALSLARPVLVPENEVTRSLRREVGADWVHGFEHPLRAEHLVTALAAAGKRRSEAVPDLGGRDWSFVAAQYTTVFERCLNRSALGRKADV